jgi:hypothetical protein
MIPPNTNELKLHSHDLAQFGKSLRTKHLKDRPASNGSVVAVIVILVALIIAVPAMQPIIGA